MYTLKINSVLAGSISIVMLAGLFTPPGFAAFLPSSDFTETGTLFANQNDYYSFDATSVGASAGDSFSAVIDNDISMSNPNTILGTFSDAGFTNPPLDTDDNSSPLGNGFASAISGVVNPNGFIYLGVTGFSNFDFSDEFGSHTADGPYHLSVILDIPNPVGGTIIPMDATSLLLAGSQMTVSWLIPVIVSAVGIGLVLARKI